MVSQALLTVLSLGTDSLIAGLVIGPLLRAWRARAGIALAFGICDGAASWLGGAVPHRMPDVPDLALYLLCVVPLALGAARSRAWLFALPLILSIDNLADGAPDAPVALLAASSALMAGVGLALGALGRHAADRLAGQGAAA